MSTYDPNTKYTWANPLHVYDRADRPAPDRPTPNHPELDDSEFVCAGGHPAREVEWLWQDRIPLGKVSLLIGDPGLGKSLLTIDIATRVTRGLPFPEIQKAEGGGGKVEGNQFDSAPLPSTLPLPPSSPSGSVIIMSASDDLTDTIRPRLDAAGADSNRIFILPKIRDLRTDFDKLRAAVEAAPNCRLVIVDPINAYVGPSDSHFHTVVRRVLEPLAALAAEKNLAILAVTHLRKNDGAAIQRAAGSMGFVSMSRTIWTVAEDPRDPSRRLFLPLKNNLGPSVSGFAFHIESHPTRRAPLVVWDEVPITLSTREALAPPKPPRRPTERDAAREFLRHVLADGPRPASDLFEEAKEQGFTPRTLQRAFQELDGHTAKQGFRAGWWWSLREYPVQHVASCEELGPDIGGPPTYAFDVGFLDALHRTIDMDRFRAVTGRKDLSPSSAVSPWAKSRRSPPPDPPDHLSPSAEQSPSRATDKHPSHSPKAAAHPAGLAKENPTTASPIKTPDAIEEFTVLRGVFKQLGEKVRSTSPFLDATSPAAVSPATTNDTPASDPPPPPKKDIIQQSPAAKSPVTVPKAQPSPEGLFPPRTGKPATIPNSIRNGALP